MIRGWRKDVVRVTRLGSVLGGEKDNGSTKDGPELAKNFVSPRFSYPVFISFCFLIASFSF